MRLAFRRCADGSSGTLGAPIADRKRARKSDVSKRHVAVRNCENVRLPQASVEPMPGHRHRSLRGATAALRDGYVQDEVAVRSGGALCVGALRFSDSDSLRSSVRCEGVGLDQLRRAQAWVITSGSLPKFFRVIALAATRATLRPSGQSISAFAAVIVVMRCVECVGVKRDSGYQAASKKIRDDSESWRPIIA